MTKVNASFEQLAHRECWDRHGLSFTG